MLWNGWSLFWSLLLLSTFSSLKCSAAVEQQSLSSTPDSALPDTPQPAKIPGSAGTDSHQTAAGTISGTVLDTNRDVLQGARVIVEGRSSSAIRILESGGNGEFAFTGLCPDTYKLTVAAPGMNTCTSSDISLHEGETRLVSVMLSVFGGATSVTVSGNKKAMAEEHTAYVNGQDLHEHLPAQQIYFNTGRATTTRLANPFRIPAWNFPGRSQRLRLRQHEW